MVAQTLSVACRISHRRWLADDNHWPCRPDRFRADKHTTHGQRAFDTFCAAILPRRAVITWTTSRIYRSQRCSPQHFLLAYEHC